MSKRPREEDNGATPPRPKPLSCMELFHQKNWAETPLGAVESWPIELRCAVTAMLQTPSAGHILVGEDLYMIYNDGYAHILGAKHPAALGRKAFDVWPEVEALVGDVLRGVVKHGKVWETANQLAILERHSSPDEAYFMLSYSPLRLVDGTPIAAWCITNETTQHVIGERRLATLCELANSTASTMEVCLKKCVQALEKNRRDFPFGAVYLVGSDRSTAKLVRSFGTKDGTFPQTESLLSLSSSSSSIGDDKWHIRDVVATGKATTVSDLTTTHGTVTLEPWNIAPSVMRVLPLIITSNIESDLDRSTAWQKLAGASSSSASVSSSSSSSEKLQPNKDAQPQVFGVLILGQNPYVRPDHDHFRQFLEAIQNSMSNLMSSVYSLMQQKKRADQLAKLNAAKTSFFNNVSHEFRTPLTLILGAVERITASAAELSPEIVSFANLLKINSNRLLQLVNNLLELSSFEAKSVAAVFEPLDVVSYTIEIASNFQYAIQAAGLKLITQKSSSPSSSQQQVAFVDRNMWEKVILNLMSNALKYTPRGGEIEISFAYINSPQSSPSAQPQSLSSSFLEIRVRDTGVGIPADAVPHLFERFFRVEKHRGNTQEGTGIGLALVKEYLQCHKGTIDVKSELGKGTTFTIRLPLGSTHLAASPQSKSMNRIAATPSRAISLAAQQALDSLDAILPKSTENVNSSITAVATDKHQKKEKKSSSGNSVSAATTSSSKSRATILVVDDNVHMRDYVGRVLQDHYDILTAADGVEAIEVIRQKRKPDLIVSDVMMPRMDGEGLLKAIRSDPSLSTLPVILLSARSNEADKILALEKGADDYLTKPFSAKELYTRVKTTLERIQLRLSVATEQEANRMKDRFLMMLSHELRTPLTPVVLLAERLLTNEKLPPTAREDMEVINNSIHLETALIDDLLEWTQLMRNTLQVKEQTVDVNNCIRRACDLLQQSFDEKSQHLIFDRTSASKFAIADDIRLQQVILNLLRNAHKFTPDNGTITVRCDSDESEKRITVRIDDTGNGIAAENLNTIFNAFQFASPSSFAASNETFSRNGLGLGLFISKGLLERMKAEISVESPGLGKGSSFTISLRAAESPSPNTQLANEQQAEVPHNRVVFLVEDNETTIRVLRRQLQERLGYHVQVATSVAEALQLAQSTQFDLLLSDIGLPDGTGWELMKQIRLYRPEVRGLALSGFGMEEDIKRSLEAGFIRHLTKPIRFDALQSAIASALNEL